jgi:hypothetical protein
MLKDFHYYCIGVLARAAGLSSEDALTIAYASQYVDDSTEGELIPIQTEGENLRFDPVRTCYSGMELVESLKWSAQKRVWVPFHFIPPRPFNPENIEPFSFVTESRSAFARLLLDQAAEEPLENHKRRLCRIGVALHTYADTWAHQDFTGRKHPGENDVEAIYVYNRADNEWEHLVIENLLFDVLPQIGHAEAGPFPDLAFQKWKCTIKPSGEEIERDNVEVFLEAAQDIYNWLRTMEEINSAPPTIPWDDLEPRIKKMFSETWEKPGIIDRVTLPLYQAYQARELEKRCNGWKEEFRDLFVPPGSFSYDRQAWRAKAITGDVDWDDYTGEDWAQMPPREVKHGFWDSLWVHFHRAALRQRHFVLEKVP